MNLNKNEIVNESVNLNKNEITYDTINEDIYGYIEQDDMYNIN